MSNASIHHFYPATTRLSKRASFGAVAVATHTLTESETRFIPKEASVVNGDLLTAHTAFQDTMTHATAIAKNLPARQATWQALNQIWPDLVKDICPLGYRSRFLKEHQLAAPERITVNPAQSTFQESLSKLNDTQLVALGEALAGSAVAQFMADSLSQQKISPANLKALLNQTKRNTPRVETSRGIQTQPQFSGFDPFGAIFAVGLTTYVYGKIKQQKTAINVGKTLMLVGIVPNLILMGTAIAALVKVALFGAPG